MVKSTCNSARQYLDALGSLLPRIDAAAIDRVTDAVFRRWLDDRQVLVLGNGGSASTAAHYVTDLVKTAWVPGQRRLRALSMTDNPGLTTAIGNDISYEETFSFPLESYARPGDLVIAISGSGNSPNIVSACRIARGLSLEIVGLTGFDGGELGRISDVHVSVPSDNYGLIEDLHLSMGHMIGQGLRRRVELHVAGYLGVADSRRYLLITPARNEAEFAERTLGSVALQTIRPTKWVIVDDGSTDDTPRLLAEFAAKHDWVEIVTRRDRGVRSVGPGVIETFYAGLERCDLEDYDYVCKLDLDLDLPKGYFEGLIRRMEGDPRLGTCSGKAWYEDPDGGGLLMELIGDEMSVGMSKFYRTACFAQIGGFARQVMWDGIDCHRCRMHGWKVRSFRDDQLKFLHLRPMGSSHKGILHGRARHGRGQYLMGTSPVYMLVSVGYRVFSKPVLVGAAATLWGYLAACATRPHRTVTRDFRRFLRRYQWRALLRGKLRAAESIEAEMADRWDPARPGPIELGRTRRGSSSAVTAGSV